MVDILQVIFQIIVPELEFMGFGSDVLVTCS